MRLDCPSYPSASSPLVVPVATDKVTGPTRTLPRLVIAKAARGEHGDQVAEVLATTKVSVMKETTFVLTMALKMMFMEVSLAGIRCV